MYILRKKIGCCSAFGSFEVPSIKAALLFDDDCVNHPDYDIEKIPPCTISKEEAEYWIADTKEDAFSRYQWYIDGIPVQQDEVIEAYLLLLP